MSKLIKMKKTKTPNLRNTYKLKLKFLWHIMFLIRYCKFYETFLILFHGKNQINDIDTASSSEICMQILCMIDKFSLSSCLNFRILVHGSYIKNKIVSHFLNRLKNQGRI